MRTSQRDSTPQLPLPAQGAYRTARAFTDPSGHSAGAAQASLPPDRDALLMRRFPGHATQELLELHEVLHGTHGCCCLTILYLHGMLPTNMSKLQCAKPCTRSSIPEGMALLLILMSPPPPPPPPPQTPTAQDPSYRKAYDLPFSNSELEHQHQSDEDVEPDEDAFIRAMMQRPINAERLRFSWVTGAAERWRHDKVIARHFSCFSVSLSLIGLLRTQTSRSIIVTRTCSPASFLQCVTETSYPFTCLFNSHRV